MILECVKEFSRHAHTYDANTPVQQEVARYLLSKLTSRPKTILDLGCGSGAIFRAIDWDVTSFTGVDSSYAMCQRHPITPSVRIINDDFDAQTLWTQLNSFYDVIVSSSALQWSRDIEKILKHVSFTCKEAAFAIFTDKTFHSIYTASGLPTFLPNAQTLIQTSEKYFTCKHEIKTFKLFFEDNLSLFRYIKASGVSGGEKKLTISQTRALIKNYPHDYLEFEVLFIWAAPKKSD